MMRRWALILGVSLFGLPVAAQDLLRVPDGCTAEVTVMRNSCVTTTIVSCWDDSWRAISHRDGKPMSVSTFNNDWAFIEWRTEDRGALVFSMVPGSGESMNIRDLMDIGFHDAAADFVVNSRIIKDEPYRLTGRTEAIGKEVILSGEPFIVFRAVRSFERVDTASTLDFEVDVLMSLERELVVEGNMRRAINGANWEDLDIAPRALAHRGEKGFLSTVSEYGCD